MSRTIGIERCDTEGPTLRATTSAGDRCEQPRAALGGARPSRVWYFVRTQYLRTIASSALVAIAASALVAATIGCSGGGLDATVFPPPPATVVTVEVFPTAVSMESGATSQLTASAKDASGSLVSGRTVAWASDNAAIATVSGSGLVSGVSAGGPVRITATVDGTIGAAQVTVTPAPVASVTVTPSSASLMLGEAVMLTATLQDARGTSLTGRTVSWTSSNAAVATVSPLGLVTAVGAGGPVSITATSEGKSGVAQVTVTTAPLPVATVTVVPASLTLAVGVSSPLGATLRDANGNVLSGRPVAWSSGNNSIATVSTAGVVTGVSAGGPVTITATAQGQLGTAAITVTPGVSPQTTIVVNAAQQFQTMTGWEALAEIGQAECDPRAYQTYKSGVLDRAANEIGINRIRLGLRNGLENPVDQFVPFKAGLLTFNQWKVSWFQVVNDNADPFVINPAGFTWGYLDYTMDELVVPLRQRLAARGENLWLNVSYTGANTGDLHRDTPAEYAEFVLAAFQHIQSKYGFVPNSLEIINEPNLGTWNATHVGQALVAAKQRLNQSGFFPEFVGPSASTVGASISFFDAMVLLPGVPQALNEIAYHRYSSIPTTGQLQGLAQRATQRGMRTAMLEHGGSGYEDLHADLTLANVSAWQQFGLAFCGDRDIGGSYFAIYGAALGSNSPNVLTGERTKYLRQYFRYVGLGAVRVGATSTDPQFAPVAFRNLNGKYVVVVKATAAGTFGVGGLPAGTYGIDYTIAGTYAQALPDVTIASGGVVGGTIPGVGVMTIFAR